MARHVLIAAFAAAMLATFPAHAQVTDPPLDGAPPPLQIPKPAAPRAAPPKPSAPRPPAADPALKAEQARLATLAADLEARKARLDARERELAEEEASLARMRADRDADYARRLAELDRQRPAPPATSQPETSPRVRVSYDDARRACTRAGMSEAVDHDFYSARYESAPRYFERQREMRGPMRMDDREGYLTVDTVCQLDVNGAVLRFEVLR